MPWRQGGQRVTPLPICEVRYLVHGTWRSGFNTQVLVKNILDERIDGWNVEWDFGAGETIRHLWRGPS